MSSVLDWHRTKYAFGVRIPLSNREKLITQIYEN